MDQPTKSIEVNETEFSLIMEGLNYQRKYLQQKGASINAVKREKLLKALVNRWNELN